MKWHSGIRKGIIDADDEVCLVHADKDSGYKHLSVPMVNIRATMRAANISDTLEQEIIDYAKSSVLSRPGVAEYFYACDIDEMDQQIIQDAMCDIKEADSLHLCYYINSGRAIRPPYAKEDAMLIMVLRQRLKTMTERYYIETR